MASKRTPKKPAVTAVQKAVHDALAAQAAAFEGYLYAPLTGMEVARVLRAAAATALEPAPANEPDDTPTYEG